MKNKFRALSLLCLSLFILSGSIQAQELTPRQQRKIERQKRKAERKQKRAIRRSLKKLYKRIINDPTLREEYFAIINECPEMDQACQARLDRITQQSVEGSNVQVQAGGLTFGICHPGENFQAFHRFIYSKKSYDCKLSSQGLVYDKSIERKLFGPGLIWDKQSIVLMCTGQAYGTSTYGTNLAAGVGFGIGLGSSFGKVGLCLAVGAGKSVGFFVGGEKITFEGLEEATNEDASAAVN